MDDGQWRFSHGNKVEAKYCPIEIDGDVKYYICPRNEICCTFGCCISSNFHFYQLWYYWLMVILMFLLCSGGTWWYRYWLQEGHYPHNTQASRRPMARQRPPPARVAYHAGRNTVVVQQIWKPQQRNGPMGFPTPPPSYSLVQNSSGVSQPVGAQAASVPVQVTKLKPSPYYQLYGPPPSYDSVITETLAERRQQQSQSVNIDQHDRQNTDIEQQLERCDTTSDREDLRDEQLHRCNTHNVLQEPLNTSNERQDRCNTHSERQDRCSSSNESPGGERQQDSHSQDPHSSSFTTYSVRSHQGNKCTALPK